MYTEMNFLSRHPDCFLPCPLIFVKLLVHNRRNKLKLKLKLKLTSAPGLFKIVQSPKVYWLNVIKVEIMYLFILI